MLNDLRGHRSRLACGGVAASLLLVIGLSIGSLRRVAHSTDWHVAPHRFVVAKDLGRELLEPASVAAAIDGSTEYLIRACEGDGRFVYCRDLERPHFRSPQYNVLRHSGAIYALCQRYAWHVHPDVPEAVGRAVAFLQRETFMRVPGRDDLLAIWSPPELTGRTGPLEAKLGGTGLGLVALVHAESIRPGLTRREDLTALGDFLIWMQRPDGSFYSKFIPTAGGRRSDWISLYYPGEAALGLVRLYELSGDRRYADAARRALLYLADSRQGQADVPADHWALLATDSLFGAAGSFGLAEDERQRLITHAVQVVTTILAQQVHSERSPYTCGGFTDDGRTTPTATRVEGLLAALVFLPPEEAALRARIERACDEAVRFLLTAQVRQGPLAGGMPRAIGRLRPLWSQSTREFNQRASEIRVDYVQHALSAWVQYAAHRAAAARLNASSGPTRSAGHVPAGNELNNSSRLKLVTIAALHQGATDGTGATIQSRNPDFRRAGGPVGHRIERVCTDGPVGIEGVCRQFAGAGESGESAAEEGSGQAERRDGRKTHPPNRSRTHSGL